MPLPRSRADLIDEARKRGRFPACRTRVPWNGRPRVLQTGIFQLLFRPAACRRPLLPLGVARRAWRKLPSLLLPLAQTNWPISLVFRLVGARGRCKGPRHPPLTTGCGLPQHIAVRAIAACGLGGLRRSKLLHKNNYMPIWLQAQRHSGITLAAYLGNGPKGREQVGVEGMRKIAQPEQCPNNFY